MTPPRALKLEEVNDLLLFWQQHAPHRVPLLEAAFARFITLGEVVRDGGAPLEEMAKRGLPGLVLVGDDDGLDAGPRGWACARLLTRWAAGAVIHGAAGTVETYRDAVRLAVCSERVVLVETGSANLMAWHRLFADAGVPTVNIYSSEAPHPVAVPRETMH